MNKRKAIILLAALVSGLILAGQLSAQTRLGPRTESFIKIFSSGTYHMKATLSASGISSTVEVYSKANRIATTMSAAGETVRIIVRDNKNYMIMDQTKMIMITPVQDASSTGAVDTSGMSYTGSGNAVFTGKNLPYEEYTDKDGSKTQFFIDGNRLAGTRNISRGETVDMVISVLDQNVPDSVFNVPTSGYEVQDFSNFNF